MRHKYNKLFLIFATVFTSSMSIAQNVGIGTATPNASAKLDVTSTNSGILVPRVALTATNAAGPITAPATSLLVYNTTTAGVTPNNVTPGYYYWNGTVWLRLSNSGENDWTKAATAATPAIKTDDQYVTGKVGIGDFSASSPLWPLQINSTGDNPFLFLNTTSATNKRVRLQFGQNGVQNWELATDAAVNNTDDFYFYNRITSTFGPLIKNNGFVGIGTTNPQVRLAINGNGTNVYNTDLWTENNAHVQGNETLTQGGRGRLRIGTAWNYIGLYSEASSTGVNNDLVLGASSALVRVGPNGGGQNLKVSGLEGTGNRRVYADANGVLNVSSTNVLVSSNHTTGTSAANTSKVVIAAGSAMNVAVGDVIIIDANVGLRLTGGSNTDDFFIRAVKTGTSVCTCSSGTNPVNLNYRPDEDGNDHDNVKIISYLDYCTVTTAGTLLMNLTVQNTGDDGWEHSQAVMVVRKE